MMLHPLVQYFEFRQICTSLVFDELLSCHVLSYNSLVSVLNLIVFSTKTMLKLSAFATYTTHSILNPQKRIDNNIIFTMTMTIFRREIHSRVGTVNLSSKRIQHDHIWTTTKQ